MKFQTIGTIYHLNFVNCISGGTGSDNWSKKSRQKNPIRILTEKYVQ